MFFIKEKNGSKLMRGKVGAWTLRWARGPGRQSGLLAINAFALALFPFVDLVRPSCNSVSCLSAWDQFLFIPRILYLPMLVIGMLLLGSWRAQRKHSKIERRHSATLDLRAERPDIPPGQGPKTMLDRDLTRRTMRGLSLGAFLGGLSMIPFLFTTIALRRCDPWPMQSTNLAVCSDSFGWADMLVAYEVWTLLVLMFLASLLFWVRSTSIQKPEGLEDPKPTKRRLRKRARWNMA